MPTSFPQEVKGESGSIVTSKLNKMRKKIIKKRRGSGSLEDASKKFSSNGSLLSKSGNMKNTLSEPDIAHSSVSGSKANINGAEWGEAGDEYEGEFKHGIWCAAYIIHSPLRLCRRHHLIVLL